MKIVYITNDAFGHGGVARMLSVKTAVLAQKYGHQVVIISSSFFDRTFYTFDPSITIKPLPFSPKLAVESLFYFKKLKKEIKLLNPDIVVICDNGIKGYLMCFLDLNVPVVFECHAIDIIPIMNKPKHHFSIMHFVLKKLVDVAVKRVDKLVVLSQAQADFLKFKNAVIVPNPAWSGPVAKASLNSNKVIAVGRLIESKGYERMIRIWKSIYEMYPDWILDIYGDGNQKEHLIDVVSKYKLNGVVSFKESDADIGQAFSQHAFMLHASYYESFALVIMEAMSFGLPVIAFDCPVGPCNIIKNNNDGFLINDFDDEAFVAKIKLLINDVSLRQDMGAKAYENIKRFDLDAIMDKWNMLFYSLVDVNLR